VLKNRSSSCENTKQDAVLNKPMTEKSSVNQRMNIREVKIDAIKQIQILRNSVAENILSNPDLVTDEDFAEVITTRGKG